MDPRYLPEAACLRGVIATLREAPCAPHWGRAHLTEAWRGIAAGEEPLVAVAFLTDAHGPRWIKSQPSWGNALYLELGTYANEHGLGVSLSLASYVWPPAREGTIDEIRMRSMGTVPPEGEIQVPLAWGGANHIGGSTGGPPATIAWPPSLQRCETGSLVRLLADAGTPPLTLDLMLLPRRMVRVGRLKIWHLRRRYQPLVSEPLRRLLSFGRGGPWPPRPTANQRYVG